MKFEMEAVAMENFPYLQKQKHDKGIFYYIYLLGYFWHPPHYF